MILFLIIPFPLSRTMTPIRSESFSRVAKIPFKNNKGLYPLGTALYNNTHRYFFKNLLQKYSPAMLVMGFWKL